MNTKLPVRAGVFDTEPQVEHAVDGLLAAGFERDAISVVAKDPEHQLKRDPEVRTLSASGAHTRRAIPIGAGIGALILALVVLIWVAPTQGEGLIVAGAVLAAAAGGGIAGGLIGAMMTRGLEPEIADFHDQAMEKSQYLVAVEERESGPPLSRASEVFEHEGTTSLPMRTD